MAKRIRTSIIPVEQHFVKVDGAPVLDKKAICAFVATGFFLDNDTYWENVKTLRPGTINTINDQGYLVKSESWFKWHYSPRQISFDTTVKEFSALFDAINAEELKAEEVILPLSGGLDSRSQAVSLNKLSQSVTTFSYSFQGGYKEAHIAKKVAQQANYKFHKFEITPGYLWDKIDYAAQTNKCYAEFTHCTQLRVQDKFTTMGTKFSLGHWGDVLFDKMTDKLLSTEEDLLSYLCAKLVKPTGMELAEDLWQSWGLEDDFETYFTNRIKYLLNAIAIDNVNAKLRAFKSLYWAPRWTSVNLAFYSKMHPISLPYYHDKICEFICTVPEEYLADRRIQIAYIKQHAPKIARVTWQDKRPFNLYTYKWSKFPYNLPYKVLNKLQREFNALRGKPYIQRNWELQFLGTENRQRLNDYINNSNIAQFIEQEIIDKYKEKFDEGNQKHTSHALSLLVTLAAFSKHFYKNYDNHISNK
ncbi:MAG: asparagine synthase-related protein [Flavobacteriaceae bacterium]